ncbi:MAG: A/G-specific adenine glycosylase [Pirellulales bacterium]|nr:A/G-specific adenine glycosylase [Pirellulales bacterium]
MNWFAAHARQLPWRDQPTAYRVWISEIMLQQTQVATVIPYFERFMASFPTIADLASADEQDLLGHWEGLGYYRRARSIHSAAKQIVQQHQGVFPSTFEQVIALPGIGRYTAGAILSISGQQRLPILEGNTQRVFSRWAAVRGAVSQPPNIRLLWEIAEAMLPPRAPGTFNQAAMELGALVCTPRNPDCAHCPVKTSCQAHRSGLQQEIPGKVKHTRYEDRTEFALVIEKEAKGERKFLLRQLPAGGRWAGLWDFPRTTKKSLDNVALATTELEKELGVKLRPGIRLKTIKHAVTKYRISLHVHEAKLASSRQPRGPWRFVSMEELTDLPMSVTGRKIVKLLHSDRQTTLPF